MDQQSPGTEKPQVAAPATDEETEHQLQGITDWSIGRIPRTTQDWLLERKLTIEEWWADRNQLGQFRIGRPPETQQDWDLEVLLRRIDRDAEVENADRGLRAELEARASETNARAESIRGYVVMGIVAALTVSPVVAMALDVAADEFGQLIAPVTGVAGTVIGYWFGNRQQSAPAQPTVSAIDSRQPLAHAQIPSPSPPVDGG